MPELTVFGELFFGALAVIVGGFAIMFVLAAAAGALVTFANWLFPDG
jgi:hypothetical protein